MIAGNFASIHPGYGCIGDKSAILIDGKYYAANDTQQKGYTTDV
jgi:hypothetical protein